MTSDLTLICAATLREMDSVLLGQELSFGSLSKWGESTWTRSWFHQGRSHCLAITGVGIPLTIARLLPLLVEHRPSLVINLGIAGAYLGSELKIGDIVCGETECFGDLGMESPGPEEFIPLGQMAWADAIYKLPLALELGPWEYAERVVHQKLRIGKGCTVNSCTGSLETGRKRRERFGCDFETMEGAGVALVGHLQGVPVAEIRAISNFASIRDMQPENIELALGNLGVYMNTWLENRQ